MTSPYEVSRWPSLTDQLALAKRMFGEKGKRILADWLREQADHIDDPAFARRFTDHITMPGVQDADYTHRFVRTGAGDLIGGIRFYRQDTARPFVEVVAHSFWNATVPSRSGLDRLRDCVKSEWSMFAPKDLRIRLRPGGIDHPSARLDVTIHAARNRDLTPPDGRVQLLAFDDVEHAVTLVQRRYEHIAASNPALARNIIAADPEDLRELHSSGQLYAIVLTRSRAPSGAVAGLIAVAPEHIAWIEGDMVQEEVVSLEHTGQGYGASAQAEWAASVSRDPQRYLVGTINGLNLPSRQTALRAGRPVVLEEVFVAL